MFFVQKLLWLTVIVLSSCGTREVVVPDPPVKIPVKASVEIEGKKKVIEKKPEKVIAGKVTFVGFDARMLERFRVVPETGTELFEPGNERYEKVDGFWWGGDRKRWFKIPDLAEAWVVAPEGKAPVGHDGVTRNLPFSVYWKTFPGLGWLSEPGWYERKGWPF